MKKMEEYDTFYVVTYMQGNDYGIKPHKEEEICRTKEELQNCLDCLDYYTYDVEIERVTRYEFNK